MAHDLDSVLDRLVHRKNDFPAEARGTPRVVSSVVRMKRAVLFSVLSLALILLEALSVLAPGGRRDDLLADQWSGYDAQ